MFFLNNSFCIIIEFILILENNLVKKIFLISKHIKFYFFSNYIFIISRGLRLRRFCEKFRQGGLYSIEST